MSVHKSMLSKDKILLFFKVILFLSYLTGVLSLHFSFPNQVLVIITPFSSFLELTPFNLLLTLFTLLLGVRKWSKWLLSYLLATFFIGWFCEWVGVNTSLLFGNYEYGRVLGWKVFGVPIIIGVNWIILHYSLSEVISRFLSKKACIIFFSSIGMVAVDFLIEPVAIEYSFWTWEGSFIPVSNYIGWLIVSFLLSLIYVFLPFEKGKNSFASLVLLLQISFFVINLFVILYFGQCYF